MDELLPCPFCGSDDLAINGNRTLVIVCGGCGLAVSCFGMSRYGLSVAWNRRAPVKTETTEDARTKETTT